MQLTPFRLQLESPLLRAFKTLYNKLQLHDDLYDVDTVLYLRPFLDVITSHDTRFDKLAALMCCSGRLV